MYIAAAGSPAQTIVWVNDAFVRRTGFTAEEIVGQAPGRLLGPDTHPELIDRFRAAIADGQPWAETLRTVAADGTPSWTRVSIAPVQGDQDGITHWFYVLVDVTDLEERHREQLAEVERERRERTSIGIISRISDILMDLDDPSSLGEVAGVLGRSVVRWAGFYLEDDDGLRPADGTDTPPYRVGRRHAAVVEVGAAAQDAAASPCTQAVDPVHELLTGERTQPVDLDLAAPAASTASGWLADQVRRAVTRLPEAPSGVVVLPVPGRRRVLGVLVVVPSDGTDAAAIDSAVGTVLQLTTRRVGLAVDNARLYEREHRVAETLQRSMLPEQADVDGLDVWSYYAPSSAHAQVGGDWFDVLEIDADVVGVVIGDVVGHDIEAAASMGQLRSVVRTYAFEVRTPGLVLERVDQLVAGMRIPRPAALVLMTLTRTDDTWRLAYSRAGHLPGLLVRDGRVTELDEAGGRLIGISVGPRTTSEVPLAPGDVLVLYTDGLIERRDRALREGLAALREAAEGVTATDAAGIGEDLLARLADDPEDDVAVVVVRIPDPAVDGSVARSPRSRRWRLPSEPAAAGRARHAVVRTCQAWGLTCGPSAELVVSELVANAVLHGWGHVLLRLDDTEDGLRIEVEDANPAPPVTTDGHRGRVGGFGMQIVERLADWGWRPAGTGKVVWAKIRAGEGTDV
ncbi:serine/threonine protein phosphatase [Cellulomonas sp. WB94]|nr:serine/threonine protein phosphatase [Cellulomonas sp. WB94]